MSTDLFDCTIIEMACRQLGAELVQDIEGTLFYIEFPVTDDFSVKYNFNVNEEQKFFLRRIQPYSFFEGELDTEDEVIDYLKTEISRFRSAVQSSNFPLYLKVLDNIQDLGDELDTMFLTHNIDKERMEYIDKSITEIRAEIKNTISVSKEIIPE